MKNTTTTTERHYTDYATAAHWGGVQLVQLDVPRIDPEIFYGDIRGNFDEEQEVFQTFVTNASDDDVRWLTATFDLCFAYSEHLECWVLLVQHWGTAWTGVACEVFSENWWTHNGEKYGYKD